MINDLSLLSSGAFDADVSSSISWNTFVNDYFIPKPIIVDTNTLSKEQLNVLEEKYSKLYKSEQNIKDENADFLGLRSIVAKLAKNSIEINNSSKPAFFIDFNREIQTLGQLYSKVFDKFTLGCLIQEAIECLKPALACKDLLRDLSVKDLKDRISLAFPLAPSTVSAINKIIDDEEKKEKEQLEKQQKAKEEGGTLADITTEGNSGPLSLMDKILNAIETIIDIEAICDLRIPFDIPLLNIPDLTTIDLFFDLNVQLDQAILEALTQALLDFILGILSDLLDCSKLDNFIGGVLSGQMSDDAGAYGDLFKLFTDPNSLSTDSAIANSFGDRWNNFVNTAGPLTENLISFQQSGSIGLLGGALSFNELKTGHAGLSGLKDVLQSGSFDKLGAVLTVKDQQNFATLDMTKLINFEGAGSEQANDFIKEMGLWQLSDDGNSFTLQRFSDDKVVLIAKTASQNGGLRNPQTFGFTAKSLLDNINKSEGIDIKIPSTKQQAQHNEENKGSQKELFIEIGKFFDTTISVLLPTEIINLVANEASMDTLKITVELARKKHSKIYNLFGTPQKMANLFATLGKTIGIDQLKNKLLLISNSPKIKKIVPLTDCRPFDNISDFRKSLLDRTLPADFLDNLINDKKKRFNDVQNGLAKIKDGIPFDLKDILCGSGKNIDGTRHEIIEDSLDTTIDLLFEPTKMMFNKEISNYINAISVHKEQQIEIPRKISNDNSLPIFNPTSTDGNLFTTINKILGLDDTQSPQEKDGDRINPEFKAMIDSGFVPVKKTGNGKQDFSIDGDKDKDYIDGTEPVYKKDVKSYVAAAFRKGIKISQENIGLKLNNDNFKITLKGSLEGQTSVANFSPIKLSSPEWIIEYLEDDKIHLNIRTTGHIFSQTKGLLPFFGNYKIEKNGLDIAPKLKHSIQEYSINGEFPKRQNVFSKIFVDKIYPHLIDKTIENKNKLNKIFEEKYEIFLKAIIHNIGEELSKNRLLKKIPNKSSTSVSPNSHNSTSKAEELIVLSLINLTPIQTDEQKECKKDPHILDIELIKKIVKDIFDKECEKKTEQPHFNGTESRETPIGKASLTGIILIFIRLYCLEQLLKSLFIFDEFKYNKNFTNNEILIDFIAFNIQNDMERLNFFKDFEKEMLKVYKKLVREQIVKPSNIESNITQNNSKKELRELISFELKQVLEKISKLIGVDKAKDIDIKHLFLNSLKIFDTFSDFGQEGEQSTHYSSINNRFSINEIPNQGKFILEKYIKIKKPNIPLTIPTGVGSIENSIDRAAIVLEQGKSEFLSEVMNFKNFEELVSNLIENNSLLNLGNKKIYDINDIENSLFDHPLKIGLRLVYVSATQESGVSRNELNSLKNKFALNNKQKDLLNLKPNKIKTSKEFWIFDKNIHNNIETFKPFNPISLLEEEITITDFTTLENINRSGILDNIFEEKYKSDLLRNIKSNELTNILFDYCFISEHLPGLFILYSSLALNNEEMKTLFDGTKNELKKVFLKSKNFGDYKRNKSEFKLKGGNSGEYQRQFDRIGHPAGPTNPDALLYWITTPIQILKALTILLDPNIFITDKIVAAFASGFMTPKFARVGSSVRLDGTMEFIVVEPGIALDNEFKQLQTGELVKLKNKTKENGNPIILFNAVALIENIENGKVSLKQETLIDGSTGPAIRVGAEFTGVPWDLENNSPASGINLDNFNELLDQKPSTPVFPGENIQVPYGSVSLALTPIQIFATILGPLCQSAYSALPLAQYFLALEPILYKLPYFKTAVANTDIKENVKTFGIDLHGHKKIGCEIQNKEDKEDNKEE